LDHAISMGLRSGEYGGRYVSVQPATCRHCTGGAPEFDTYCPHVWSRERLNLAKSPNWARIA
jgi:hypothetical protein